MTDCGRLANDGKARFKVIELIYVSGMGQMSFATGKAPRNDVIHFLLAMTFRTNRLICLM